MEKTLIRSSTDRLRAEFAVVLVWAFFSACATTQRSSTSDAGRLRASPPAPMPAPASESAPPASGAPAAAASTKSSASTDDGGPMRFPNDSNAVQANDQAETDQAKQQLADDDAAISELRKQQEADANQMQADQAHKEASAESAGQAGQQSEQQPEATRTPSPAAALRKDEEAVQFPENKQGQPEKVRPAARNEPAAAAAEVSPSEPGDRSVYFNYDEATVLAKFDAMLMADAAYLSTHPNQGVEVQGNCDERGSREYDLALGARRAESIKRALELGGVASNRIHAISFGAEKPVAMGHDEDSWSRNRRADIVDK